MASLSIEQVRKSFGAVDVLSDVSLEIADGEFVVLVGPSGCGKSTLLRIIAGLETATEGFVRLGDRVLNKLAPKDRNIAMVFQSYALYPHMSVTENMSFGLKMRGENADTIGRQVSAAAQTLGLEVLLDRFPRQLSGGQRQRVAMGRAIVRSPEVFLFDEPLSNLDAKLRVQMRTEIRELQQRLGTTTVYVTHDQVEAMTMADKIVVMNGGRIEQIGTPLALYDRPANLFVASFLGSPGMNLLDGRVETADTPRFVIGGDLAIPLEGLAVPPGDAVLGFRPEHLSLAEHGLPAHIVAIEPTGLDTILVLDLGDRHITGIFRQRLALRPAERIAVSVQPEHIHLFHRDTGVRMQPALISSGGGRISGQTGSAISQPSASPYVGS